MGQVFYEILKLGSSGIQQNADTPASDCGVLEANVLFSIELRNSRLFMRMIDLPKFEGGSAGFTENVDLGDTRLPMKFLLPGTLRTSSGEIPPQKLQIVIRSALY